MICDEPGYREAVQRLEAERARLQAHTERLLSEGLDEEQLKRALDPFRAFSLQLEEEVQYYERLKRGDMGDLDNLHGLGRSLVALRIALGLTRREFAQRLNVAESQVSRDERDEYHGITIERVSRILDALGVRLHSTFEPLPRPADESRLGEDA